jgi:hypothetical protein
MLFEVCEQEFQAMEAALGKINQSTDMPAERLKTALSVIRKSLHYLSDHLLTHPLASAEEQIRYGKELLPQFYAWYIYHQEWYAILSALPVSTNKKVRAFWLDELRVISRFPTRYSLHHAYYKMADTSLDKVLFVPGTEPDSALVPVITDYDPIFTTSCSYLFAKFRAYELLSASIMEAMTVRLPMVHAPASARKRTREMRWTGESINLVELGFGFYDTKQMNEGNASLIEIFEWMEEVLHIRIGRPARRFEELETRKTTSPTSYLDKMRHEINMRIDRKLTYDPNTDAPGGKRKARRLPFSSK